MFEVRNSYVVNCEAQKLLLGPATLSAYENVLYSLLHKKDVISLSFLFRMEVVQRLTDQLDTMT